MPPSESVDDPLGQDCGAPQGVPLGYVWQRPVPSHLPFVEQAGPPLSVQTCLGSTVPAGKGVHVPAPPLTLQAIQEEEQLALMQQTLSTQWLVPHWLSAVQALPGFPFATHVPAVPVQ